MQVSFSCGIFSRKAFLEMVAICVGNSGGHVEDMAAVWGEGLDLESMPGSRGGGGGVWWGRGWGICVCVWGGGIVKGL